VLHLYLKDGSKRICCGSREQAITSPYSIRFTSRGGVQSTEQQMRLLMSNMTDWSFGPLFEGESERSAFQNILSSFEHFESRHCSQPRDAARAHILVPAQSLACSHQCSSQAPFWHTLHILSSNLRYVILAAVQGLFVCPLAVPPHNLDLLDCNC
jgi:hypothetical protein